MSLKRLLKVGGLLAACSTVLGACATETSSPTTGLYAKPIGDAPVTRDDTPYSSALTCLARYARSYNITPPRIAVGRILDLTGTTTQLTGSQLTQGASMFAMTAVGKAGGRLVERYDTIVPEIELKYASGKLLSDTPERAGQDPNNFRRTYIGQIAGSEYYIVGGITELNGNIASKGANLNVGSSSATGAKGTAGAQNYVMNVAMDIRLINSRTQEVVDMVSYQKQLVGTQVSAGFFDFFHGTVLDVSAGGSAMEPAHLAVRTLVERATFEFMSKFYGLRDHRYCLSPKDDVLSVRY